MLEDIADHLGTRIALEPPRAGQLGGYDHSKRLIRLHLWLSGLLQTSVLAHELGVLPATIRDCTRRVRHYEHET